MAGKGNPKGVTGNPNGRPKGSTNKATSETREWLAKLLDDNKDRFVQDLMMVSPKERLDALCKILPFIVPKPRDPEEAKEQDALATAIRKKLFPEDAD